MSEDGYFYLLNSSVYNPSTDDTVSVLLKINSLPNYKILDWLKMKAFGDDNVNVSRKLKFDLGRVEIIVGKGENT